MLEGFPLDKREELRNDLEHFDEFREFVNGIRNHPVADIGFSRFFFHKPPDTTVV